MSDNTIARSLHDLGAAAWFGGSLMGAVGVNGAATTASEPADRVMIGAEGWRRWVPWNLAAIVAHLAGGAVLLKSNRRRMMAQSGVPTLAGAKTIVTGLALAVTAYSRMVGRKIQDHEPAPTGGPTVPGPDTPDDLARWQRQERVLQWAIPVLSGVLIVLNTRMSEQQRPSQVLSGVADRLLH